MNRFFLIHVHSVRSAAFIFIFNSMIFTPLLIWKKKLKFICYCYRLSSFGKRVRTIVLDIKIIVTENLIGEPLERI